MVSKLTEYVIIFLLAIALLERPVTAWVAIKRDPWYMAEQEDASLSQY